MAPDAAGPRGEAKVRSMCEGRCNMTRTLLAMLAAVLCGAVAVAQCYHSDSPDCACFNSAGVWNPTGTWIQDIALATVGTVESCVSDGGKPFYQMRLGLNSSASANIMAVILQALTTLGTNPYEREAWCSETISYWHREAGIPYSTGYRNSSWHLDWQLTNTEAIRTFYMVEELLALTPLRGRGRWIDWSDLNYSDFQPGVNAPAPGSYVLIRAYNPTTTTWGGNSHSMMINEMTVHKNHVGKVVRVAVTLLEGNAGSPGQVRSTVEIDDLAAYMPGGSETFSGGRKILGFGVDLNSGGNPIFDSSRLRYQTDLYAVATVLKPIRTRDPLWSQHYAVLVDRLVAYAKATGGQIRVDGPATVIGKGGIPDGRNVTWAFGPELDRAYPNGVTLTIDLLREHPLPVRGVSLRWTGAVPKGSTIRYAGETGLYAEVPMPSADTLKLLQGHLQSTEIPVSFGKSVAIRRFQLVFPRGAFGSASRLVELRLLYDWGPGEDARVNP